VHPRWPVPPESFPASQRDRDMSGEVSPVTQRRAVPSPESPLEEAEHADEHGRAILSLNFSDLYESETVSDVILDLEGMGGESVSVPAHRVVLVAGSTYFASMFSSAWEQQPEGGGKPRHVRLVSEERLAHLRLFLAFLYGVEVQLDLSRAHPLLRLADFYGVDALMNQSIRYLERILHPQPTRCFSLFERDEPAEVGEAGGDGASTIAPPVPPQERLIALCTEVLARSFTEASAHPSFSKCPVELLAAVLERDDLSVDKEDEVLDALLQWTEHDEPRRADPHLLTLISLVRWPLMDGGRLAEIEDVHPLLSERCPASCELTLRGLLLEALKYQAAGGERKAALTEQAQAHPEAARRLRPRTPNMVRLQGDGRFCWTLKNFARLATEERIYSPPFVFSGIAFMLLFFPRGNQQREYASLYVSVADKTKLPAGWRSNINFSLSVIDQRESLCSVTKSTQGELTTQVLDWGFTELLPLATLHSTNHGYILNDALLFNIQFERITEGGSGSGRAGRASASTPPPDMLLNRHV